MFKYCITRKIVDLINGTALTEYIHLIVSYRIERRKMESAPLTCLPATLFLPLLALIFNEFSSDTGEELKNY